MGGLGDWEGEGAARMGASVVEKENNIACNDFDEHLNCGSEVDLAKATRHDVSNPIGIFEYRLGASDSNKIRVNPTDLNLGSGRV